MSDHFCLDSFLIYWRMPLNISFTLKGEMTMKSKKFTLLLLSLLLFLPLFLTNFITPNFALAESPKQGQKVVGYFSFVGHLRT